MEPSRDRRLPEIPVPVQDQGSHRRPMLAFRQDAHCFEVVRIVHLEATIQQLVTLDRYAVEQRRNGWTVGRFSRKCRTGFRFIATFRDVELRKAQSKIHMAIKNKRSKISLTDEPVQDQSIGCAARFISIHCRLVSGREIEIRHGFLPFS